MPRGFPNKKRRRKAAAAEPEETTIVGGTLDESSSEETGGIGTAIDSVVKALQPFDGSTRRKIVKAASGFLK